MCGELLESEVGMEHEVEDRRGDRGEGKRGEVEERLERREDRRGRSEERRRRMESEGDDDKKSNKKR